MEDGQDGRSVEAGDGYRMGTNGTVGTGMQTGTAEGKHGKGTDRMGGMETEGRTAGGGATATTATLKSRRGNSERPRRWT